MTMCTLSHPHYHIEYKKEPTSHSLAVTRYFGPDSKRTVSLQGSVPEQRKNELRKYEDSFLEKEMLRKCGPSIEPEGHVSPKWKLDMWRLKKTGAACDAFNKEIEAIDAEYEMLEQDQADEQ